MIQEVVNYGFLPKNVKNVKDNLEQFKNLIKLNQKHLKIYRNKHIVYNMGEDLELKGIL